MERDRGVVLATERYGSAESWKYFGKDGGMERRRDGSESESRGNSVVGVFKVSTFPRGRADCPVPLSATPDSHYSILFQSVFLPQGYPESVSSDYLQYQFWDTLQVQ